MAVENDDEIEGAYLLPHEFPKEPFGIAKRPLVQHPYHMDEGFAYIRLSRADKESLRSIPPPDDGYFHPPAIKPSVWKVYFEHPNKSQLQAHGYTTDPGLQEQAEVYKWNTEAVEPNDAVKDMVFRDMKYVQSWIRPIQAQFTTFELFDAFRVVFENAAQKPTWLGKRPEFKKEDYYTINYKEKSNMTPS